MTRTTLAFARKSERFTALPLKSLRVKSGAGVLRLMDDMLFSFYFSNVVEIKYILIYSFKWK